MILSSRMQDLCIDNLYDIFNYIEIIDLIKFRCVSKYLQKYVNIYISKNEKKCDMMAYNHKFLITPEYLIKDTKLDVNDYINRYMKKNRKALRLIKIHIYTSSKVMKLCMPVLKYLIINDNFKTENIYMPSIKFYNYCHINVNKYDITFACVNIFNKFNKTNDRINSAIATQSELYKMTYFPNIKNVYMFGIFYS